MNPGACVVCNEGDSREDNQIIYCDGPGCDIPVHQGIFFPSVVDLQKLLLYDYIYCLLYFFVFLNCFILLFSVVLFLFFKKKEVLKIFKKKKNASVLLIFIKH